jgi:MFS transporter, AAHS family, 4-hydroxybenzoate transporter
VSAAASSNRRADVGQLLDHGVWTTLQRSVVALAACAIMMDGFDGQLIGFAIPSMIKEWGVSRGDFAPVVAAGLVGMGFGSGFGGVLADRFGRRPALIASVFIFGLATACIGFSQNLLMVGSLRFVAGLGIGGALPGSTTMAAEFTPVRRRTLAVTATIVCVPLGGMLAGVVSGLMLQRCGWRALFFLGGVLALGLGAALAIALPESPKFLARRPERWSELSTLLGRMGRPVPSNCEFADADELAIEKRLGYSALFEDGRGRDTIALWFAFFLCLLAIYSAFSWLPTMLVSAGLDISTAGSGLTAYNLGGVIGALLCAAAITRFGSRLPLAICCLGGAITAFGLEAVDLAKGAFPLIVGFGLHGLFANAIQSTMYALCAYVYPTPVRATGAAAALVTGRLGAIVSSFLGAWVITNGGATGYLTMLAVAMIGVFIALISIRRHIPAVPRQPGGETLQ